MRQSSLLFPLVFAISLFPAVSPSQESVSVATTRPFFGIGNLTIEAELEVKGKAAEDAPTLEELEKHAVAQLDGTKLSGTLPGRVVIRSNTFLSKVTGDVIISVVVDVRRPVSILGTTEVMEATVWSQSTVGRSKSSEAKSFVLESVADIYTNLRKAAAPQG